MVDRTANQQSKSAVIVRHRIVEPRFHDELAALDDFRCWRPKRTAAHQVILRNLDTWLARRRAGGLDAGANLVVDRVSLYVERDRWKYLECAILAPGFTDAL